MTQPLPSSDHEHEDAVPPEPEGQSLADDLIGEDAEPEDGWLRFNSNGDRVDENGNVIPDPERA